MEDYKTLEERYGNEVLTDNASLNHFSQCKDCIFRDKTSVDGQECGWNKCFCHIYGCGTVSRIPADSALKIPYSPVEYEDKPREVFDNTEECEYYEKEKQRK